jgi:hypothetical protein
MVEEDEFNADFYTKQQREKKSQAEAIEAAPQDPELSAIRERSKRVQLETVDSSENTVRMLRETVRVSDITKTELIRQGEELKDIKCSSERADSNVTEAYQNTRDIDRYSRFLPIFWSSNKKKKKEDKALEMEQKAIEKESKRSSKQFVENSNSSPLSYGTGPSYPKEYADDNEQRIDENLDEISMHLRLLRQDAMFMQQSMLEQESDIKEIQARTIHTQNVMELSDKKLQKHL